MNLLFLDLETTFQIDEKKRKDPSPYIAENYLVSAGWAFNDDSITYRRFNPAGSITPYGYMENISIDEAKETNRIFREALSKAELLVAHNMRFELAWLRACGFKYDGPIYCTQIAEYVLARGQRVSLKLRDLCEQHNLTRKRVDLTEEYLSKGIGFEKMPWEVVEEYGKGDVISLKELYDNQQFRLMGCPHLYPTINLMLEFLPVLVEMEETGIKIDVAELDRLEKEYKATLASLDSD